MTDPVSIASFCLQLLAKTTEALTGLRERAQRNKDLDIKEQISTLFDNILALKDAVSRLIDENRSLRQQLSGAEEKPTLKRVGDTNFYYKGDEGPFCQRCYDKDGKFAALQPQQNWNRGIRRECTVCGEYFYEQRGTAVSTLRTIRG